MKTVYIVAIFILVAGIQLFVPAKMIFDKEAVIASGTAYKFKTRPIDPNDPFRGKYITLNYDINSVKTDDTLWRRDDQAHVYLTKDANGFAEALRVTREKQDITNDFIIAKVSWYNKHSREVNIELPFNRYYMEESKAYDAELAVRNAQRDSLPHNTYALVHVKNGSAVLSDVLIDNISIKDYVQNQASKKGGIPD